MDDGLFDHCGCCGHSRRSGCGGKECPCRKEQEMYKDTDLHSLEVHNDIQPEGRREIFLRQCPMHDPGRHWIDDYDYVFGTDDAEENPPTWRDFIRTLRTAVDMTQKIHKFSIVFVKDDGTLQCMASPGMGHHGAVNLLAKAISIMSYQEDAREIHEREQVAALFGGLIPGTLPGVSSYSRENEDESDESDGTGQYL